MGLPQDDELFSNIVLVRTTNWAVDDIKAKFTDGLNINAIGLLDVEEVNDRQEMLGFCHAKRCALCVLCLCHSAIVTKLQNRAPRLRVCRAKQEGDPKVPCVFLVSLDYASVFTLAFFRAARSAFFFAMIGARAVSAAAISSSVSASNDIAMSVKHSR